MKYYRSMNDIILELKGAKRYNLAIYQETIESLTSEIQKKQAQLDAITLDHKRAIVMNEIIDIANSPD